MCHRSIPIEDYGALDEGVKSYLKSTYGAELGGPRKAVERILDVIKREGMVVKDGAQMPIDRWQVTGSETFGPSLKTRRRFARNIKTWLESTDS